MSRAIERDRCRLMVVGLLVAALLLGAAGPALADQPDRPTPDYDGREEPSPDGKDVLIWIPRIVLYPVYLVTEYLVRWPLGKFLTWAERERVFERLGNVFTFGTGGRVGLIPTFLLDFGFRPSIGLYFWASPVFAANDYFSIHFAWGGPGWWRLSVREEFDFGGSTRDRYRDPESASVPLGGGVDDPLIVARPVHELNTHFLLNYRPDYLFHGIGPDAPAQQTRFRQEAIGGAIEYGFNFGQLHQLRLSVSATRNRFDDGDFDREDGELAISEAFDTTSPLVVPGFDGYTLGLTGLRVAFDSRDPRPAPGSGARLGLLGELGTDFANTDVLFLRYGGDVSFFIDLSGRNQTIGIRQFVGLIEELGDAPTPFTELWVVGGHPEYTRGHLEGRYRGLSGAVTSLTYAYPIWVFIDGYIFADVGNAFGANFEGFDVAKMVLSFGMGVRTNASRDSGLNILIGAGTTPFDAEAFGLENIRLIFGTGGF